MRTLKATMMLALAVVPLFGSPRRAFGQDCGYVDVNLCGSGQHSVPGGPPNNRYTHGACQTCYEGYPCHPTCLDQDFLSVSRGTILPRARAAAAAQAGDAYALISLGLVVPNGQVAFNRRRNAVQLLSCDRETVVASITLRSPFLRRLAEGLRSARSPQALAEGVWPPRAVVGGGD